MSDECIEANNIPRALLAHHAIVGSDPSKSLLAMSTSLACPVSLGLNSKVGLLQHVPGPCHVDCVDIPNCALADTTLRSRTY